MKLYRFFICFVFLGLLAGAAYSQTDPGVGLRGGTTSTDITTTVFSGMFPGAPTCTDPTSCADANFVDYINAIPNNATIVGISLTFTTDLNLSYTCDNSLDPYFTSCSYSGDTVTFSGTGTDATGLCGGSESGQPACPGILSGNDFRFTLDTGDAPSFTGMAEVVTTPEPASAVLFVIGIGAIALFLKRA